MRTVKIIETFDELLDLTTKTLGFEVVLNPDTIALFVKNGRVTLQDDNEEYRLDDNMAVDDLLIALANSYGLKVNFD